MKKIVMMLATVLLGTSMATTVFAETSPSVWSENTVGSSESVSTAVETDGTVTDGVLEIKFDASVLSCSEADVEISDEVDMYSVNVVDGSVKVSFLSEDEIKEGALLQVKFNVVNAAADVENAITFYGEAHKANGADVVVKVTEPAVPEVPGKPEDPAAPEEPGNNGGTQNNGTESNGGTASVSANNVSSSASAPSVDTGDTSGFAATVFAMGMGCILVIAGVRRKMSH